MRRPHLRQPVLIALAVGASLLSAAASAQQAPTFGPPIPGMCIFGRSAALEGSNRGREVAARIAAAGKMVSARAQGDRSRIQSELSRPGQQDPSRRAALMQELNAVQQFENDARNSIQARSAEGYAALEPSMVAALSKVVTERRCSLIVERAITYGWNNGMDVTDAVIAAMNASP